MGPGLAALPAARLRRRLLGGGSGPALPAAPGSVPSGPAEPPPARAASPPPPAAPRSAPRPPRGVRALAAGRSPRGAGSARQGLRPLPPACPAASARASPARPRLTFTAAAPGMRAAALGACGRPGRGPLGSGVAPGGRHGPARPGSARSGPRLAHALPVPGAPLPFGADGAGGGARGDARGDCAPRRSRQPAAAPRHSRGRGRGGGGGLVLRRGAPRGAGRASWCAGPEPRGEARPGGAAARRRSGLLAGVCLKPSGANRYLSVPRAARCHFVK